MLVIEKRKILSGGIHNKGKSVETLKNPMALKR